MIRKYLPQDCDCVVNVWLTASRIATPFLSTEFLTREADNIRNLWLPESETWIAAVDDQVVGFTTLIKDEVGAIFVHPSAQGRGYGRALMDRAVSLREGRVWLDVFEKNVIGRRFYDSYGFEQRSSYLHEETGQMMLRLAFEQTQP